MLSLVLVWCLAQCTRAQYLTGEHVSRVLFFRP
jgi:hypothetical protein